ncbi:MAG TPA: hydroxymethylbilane synthase, partial [bacterium]|nr:hydroxymethylbilane synthase [bacterium]
MRPLILATRGSKLALTQSKLVADQLQARHAGLLVQLLVMKSEGDQKADAPLAAVGGQGLFTKALEDALLKGEADLAVHSLKDLPVLPAPGLALAAVSPREDWREAWISPVAASPWELPAGALIGTGSLRRRAQLLRKRPDFSFAELRGNVDTRLKKIAAGEVQGAVLALAGLKRLGLQAHARCIFGEEELLPAPGQGFLGLETRAGGQAYELCRALNDAQAEAEATAERALLDGLEAGCHAPVGALARTQGLHIHLKAFVGLDASHPIDAELYGDVTAAEALGRALAA